MSETILIVDDKVHMTRLLHDYLKKHGYRPVVAHDGREALFVARHEKPDLILLDINMPEMDGYEFIRVYRKERTIPIIVLTTRVDEADKVLGLELGADDYLTKPFGMAELRARIRSVMRRVRTDYDVADVSRLGNLVLDRGGHTVTVNSKSIDLTSSEFELLNLLLTSKGRVFSRSELLDHLQGNDFTGTEKTVNVHIHNLRSKLEVDPKKPRYILTVFGAGYRCATDEELQD